MVMELLKRSMVNLTENDMTTVDENKSAMQQPTGPLTGSKEGTTVRSPNSTKPGENATYPTKLKVDHCGPESKR